MNSTCMWCLGLSLLPSILSFSQDFLTHPANGVAFPEEEIAVIRIECGEAIDWMLTEENWYSNVEHPASFVFESSNGIDSIPLVGFRLRGNTSRAAAKKSFKVVFDYAEDGHWNGLSKMNLNGEHNDPSVMRANLVWAGMRDAGIPVSRNSHVHLFINGLDFGVYSNMEHIDGRWLEKRFEHAHGNLWKCTYPSTLMYEGPDGDDYKFTPEWSSQRVYELKTNKAEDDYSALARFIDVLNNTPLDNLSCALEDVFDVQHYLKTAAAEILCGHWDNYIGNKNNFYLYQRQTDGRIMYIPYDVDNSLGVQWFGNWTNQDLYEWTDANDRPLYTRLLAIPAYREAFTWYLQDLMSNTMTASWFSAQGQDLQDLLAPDIENDPYYPLDYGFDLEAFENALTDAWGNHIAHGIVPFIENRQFWANIQLDVVPEIGPLALTASAMGPVLSDTLSVKAFVPATLGFQDVQLEAEITWADNSITQHVMGILNTSVNGIVWGTKVPLENTESVHWRVHAQAGDQTAWSPCEPQLVWNQPMNNGLVINEVMALNNSFISDNEGGYADWVELFNASNSPINISSYYLTNRWSEPNRWSLPNVTLDSGQHLLIWCDDDTDDGPLHASFHLDAMEDELFIMAQDSGAWRAIDQTSWVNAQPNLSWGRSTDGANDWMWFAPFSDTPPTPNSPNGNPVGLTDHTSNSILDWNPVNPCLAGSPIALPTMSDWSILHASGQLIHTGHSLEASTIGLSAGLYFIQIQTSDGLAMTKPIVVTPHL